MGAAKMPYYCLFLVLSLSSLNGIIIDTTFRYNVRASEGNLSLCKCSYSNASSRSGVGQPYLVSK